MTESKNIKKGNLDRENAIFFVICFSLLLYTLPIWYAWIGIFTEFDRERSGVGELFIRNIGQSQNELGILKKLLLPLISALTVKSLWGDKNSGKGWGLIIFLMLSLGALILSTEWIDSGDRISNILSYDNYFTSENEVKISLSNYLGNFLEGLITLTVLTVFLNNLNEK